MRIPLLVVCKKVEFNWTRPKNYIDHFAWAPEKVREIINDG